MSIIHLMSSLNPCFTDIITITIDSNIIKVGNREVEIDVPAQIINGRTMIPIRAISEILGAEVIYNESKYNVTITLDNIKVQMFLAYTARKKHLDRQRLNTLSALNWTAVPLKLYRYSA